MRTLVVLALFFALAGCDSNQSCSGGALQTTDLLIGTGAEAMLGNSVIVDYEGQLENGSVFDEGLDAEFDLSRVIPGFRDGIVGMQVGGRREIVIPPDLAYGEAGIQGVIPSCETLTFDVTLLDVQ